WGFFYSLGLCFSWGGAVFSWDAECFSLGFFFGAFFFWLFVAGVRGYCFTFLFVGGFFNLIWGVRFFFLPFAIISANKYKIPRRPGRVEPEPLPAR
ncbi:hypothetical protein ACQWKP_22930, partial [Salmonella enterica subsp. enterica serovar Infantis]